MVNFHNIRKYKFKKGKAFNWRQWLISFHSFRSVCVDLIFYFFKVCPEICNDFFECYSSALTNKMVQIQPKATPDLPHIEDVNRIYMCSLIRCSYSFVRTSSNRENIFMSNISSNAYFHEHHCVHSYFHHLCRNTFDAKRKANVSNMNN